MTATTTLPVAENRTWDLSELLTEPTEAVIGAELATLEVEVAAFAGRRQNLEPTMSPADFLAVVEHHQAIHEHLKRLAGYASLWFAADTQSAAALSYRNRIQQILTLHQNRMMFFGLWWKDLADAAAERLLPTTAETADQRHFLEEMRLFKPYTLDERSEQIINLKEANGVSALLTLYSMLTSRLEFDIEIDGEQCKLTDGEMRGHFYSPDPDLRRRIYLQLYGEVYAQESQVLAQIYANRVRDWHTEYVELRGFSSPIAVRNLSNDVPNTAVEALLEVTRRNTPLFQEYFRLKGGWLGMDQLRRYDLYAPLASSDKTVDYATGVAEVLATFRAFDGRFADLAERVFKQRHIDSEIRKGKRGGAFCATLVPGMTPWVHLSYSGQVRDIATLAHELGHAVHSMMAEHHSVLTQHPSLPLAETASVFAEMLCTDRLLANETDPMTRRELLAALMDDIYATVMRQAYFVRFELAAHQAVLDNKSAEDLSDLYLQQLREQFGDSMVISPEMRYEWLSIPHLFSTPFYCYAYSFGQLLVLALYRRYQEQGEAFKEGYFRLLAYGGAARPEAILSELDIDINDPAFWQGGFDVVRGILDELRAIEL